MTAALLISGGRVIDPADGSDGVRDLLVRDGVIAAVGAVGERLDPAGAVVVDAAGMIVGPGFVDLHSHVHSIAGQRLQAHDGVTTALDLEAGMMPVATAYAAAAAQGRPLNYGFSASWAGARAQVLLGREPDATIDGTLELLGDQAWQRSSSAVELTGWLALLEREIADGALGIGVLLGYAPRTDPGEYLAVAKLAAAGRAPTFTHVRELVEADPSTPVDGSEEVLRAAAETGAAMHHCHINSTSRRHIDRVLADVQKSRDAGARVTLEAYPYGAGSTSVGAYFLEPERLRHWGISPSSLVVVESSERIGSADRLRQLRSTSPATEVLVEFLAEDDPVDNELLYRSLAFPDAVVASDAMPVLSPALRSDPRRWPLPPGSATHPRTAGTFCRSLRTMVRERGQWSWPEAFRRCSYLPARVLDEISPGATAKGHLGIGADADLVVFDPDAVTDRATYSDPTAPSAGVRQLFVHGSPVISDGALLTDAYPGRPLRGEPR